MGSTPEAASGQAGSQPPSEDGSRQEGASVLAVDDSAVGLELLVGMLQQRGYSVRPARNGQEALLAAQAEPPDLVLLDIVMPVMDGWEVCERLKADARTRDVPVIFVTSRDELKEKTRAFSIGGVDYITKPYQAAEVLARVETHLAIRSLQTSLEDRNEQLQEKNDQLQAALSKVKTLSGIIPICANCKKIRDDQSYWHQVEAYVRDHSDAVFSHSICPECVKELYP